MITGNKEKRIKEYLLIDHEGVGYGYVKPYDGVEFFGIPYGWETVNSLPFIEHRLNGEVIVTVNALDVSEIAFEEKRKG